MEEIQHELQQPEQEVMPTKAGQDLKKIIYAVAGVMATIIITGVGWLYKKMDDRVTAIEVRQAHYEQQSIVRVGEYSKQIAVMTAQMESMKSTLDNLEKNQKEVLQIIRALELNEAKRDGANNK
jgi:hypothetical protein